MKFLVLKFLLFSFSLCVGYVFAAEDCNKAAENACNKIDYSLVDGKMAAKIMKSCMAGQGKRAFDACDARNKAAAAAASKKQKGTTAGKPTSNSASTQNPQGLPSCRDQDFWSYEENKGKSVAPCWDYDTQRVRNKTNTDPNKSATAQNSTPNVVRTAPEFKPNWDLINKQITAFNSLCATAAKAPIDECLSANAGANQHCDPVNSPEASGGADALNQISQSVAALGAQGRDGNGVLLACKGLVQAMSAGNAVMQAVQAACTGYRDTCLKSCQPTPDKIRKTCSPIENNVGQAAEKELRNQYEQYVSQNQAQSLEVVPAASYDFTPHIARIEQTVERVTTAKYKELDIVPDQKVDQCKKMDSHIKDAQVAMNSLAQTGQAATMCGNQVSNMTLPNYCNENPSAPGCGVQAADCSNPQIAATDKICICRSNPSAPGCGGVDMSSMGRGSRTGVLGGDAASTTSTSKGSSALNNVNFGSLDAMSNAGKPSGGGGDDSVGGSKGGAGASAGGLSGGGGGGAGGGGAGGDDSHANILSGFRGGGGGAGFGGGGTYGSGEGVPVGNGYDNPAVTNYGGGPDLRQFLPGGEMDPQNKRGLAGVVGPDGITGPHSDLWRNVKNRYQSVESSLLP